MKTCTKCNIKKQLSDFAKDKQKSDGYRSSCKACNLAYRAAYYAANREEAIKYSRNWYLQNREKALEGMREWVNSNKEQANANWRNRRARQRSAQGSHSSKDVDALRERQKHCCACCGNDLRKCGAHVDHVIPLVAGGSNDATNLQLLCPTCNLKKGAKHPVDFMQGMGYLL